MGAKRRSVDPAKIAELKVLYERGWLGQHCSSVLADAAGIHREEGQSGEDALMAFRRKRLERTREMNQSQRVPYPGRGSQCDVLIDPSTIVACPPGTPIEAPAAMRPDSPAAPTRPMPPPAEAPQPGIPTMDLLERSGKQPDTSSLRGRIESLLAGWERERCANIAAAADQSLPEEIRDAARRAADVGGIYIEELDCMYHEYVREIA